MARIRSIKPEVWNDPDVVSCSPLARLLWIGTWNHADDYGVLKDDPGRLKLQILPADDVDPHVLVDELVESRLLLRRVASDGTRVLVIRTFCVHQKIDKRATGRWGVPDDFTDPPEPPARRPLPSDPAESPPIPTDPAESPEAPTSPDHTNGRERKGEEETYATSESPPTLTLVPDPVPPPAAEELSSDQRKASLEARQDDESRDPQSSASEIAAQRFEEHFWPIWPRRHGRRVGKKQALAVWKRLNTKQQRAALRGAKHYAAWCDQTDTYPKDAERWLRDRLWEEWQDPSAPPPDRKAPATAAAYQQASYRGDSKWA